MLITRTEFRIIFIDMSSQKNYIKGLSSVKNPSEVIKSGAMSVLQTIKQTVVDTFHEISVHGFIFLVKRGTNIVERLMWLVCIVVGVSGIIILGFGTWDRYQTSPTVISMDRNKFSWNTSFPTCELRRCC